ncbi:MAG TPA: hypothetical protein VEI97_16195 [bacterium]|nr:hypothetical protein [bacterium]
MDEVLRKAVALVDLWWDLWGQWEESEGWYVPDNPLRREMDEVNRQLQELGRFRPGIWQEANQVLESIPYRFEL